MTKLTGPAAGAIVTLAVMAAAAAPPAPARQATGDFLARLKQAVDAADRRTVATMVAYPLTVLASSFGNRLSRRIGPGLCLVLGIAVCGAGWLVVSAVPANDWGVFAFSAMLFCFGVGAVLIFINFLALRQAVTPEPLLGRMTSTMRWLILLPAGPGALLGGWLGEHLGLRAALAFAGGGALLLAVAAARHPVIRGVKELPTPEAEADLLGAEATVRPSMEAG